MPSRCLDKVLLAGLLRDDGEEKGIEVVARLTVQTRMMQALGAGG